MSKGNRVVRASSLPSSRVARRGYAGRDCAVGREHDYDCCIFFFYSNSLRARRTRKEDRSKIAVFCFVDISEGVVNSGVQAKKFRNENKIKSRYAVYFLPSCCLGLLYLSKKTILFRRNVKAQEMCEAGYRIRHRIARTSTIYVA